eukprot:scaffold678884_cov20-Prasinocladus_malaysianus.AAC.1
MQDPKEVKDRLLLGSLTVGIVKQINRPIMVVKDCRACELVRYKDGTTEPIKLIMQVTTARPKCV